jgi:hypothetical protein
VLAAAAAAAAAAAVVVEMAALAWGRVVPPAVHVATRIPMAAPQIQRGLLYFQEYFNCLPLPRIDCNSPALWSIACTHFV